MIRLANVLVAEAPADAAAPLLARLQHAGYHAICVEGGPALAARAASDHPDLIIIGETGLDGIELSTRLKADPATHDIPVVLLTRGAHTEQVICALAAGCDDVIDAGADEAELIARLRPLVRLATMHSELSQRSAVAARFGVEAQSRADRPDPLRPALLVAGLDDEHLAALLTVDADLTATSDLFDAEGCLERNNFDAAIVVTHGGIETELAFATQVRNNPRLFNLPIVMVVDDGIDPIRPYGRGVSRVLVRPLEIDLLRAAVLALVRRQKLRWSIRTALFDSLRDPTRDPLTGTYSRAFLDAYLSSRLAVATEQHRHLTVIFFFISSLSGMRRHFGDEPARQLMRQLGQWVTGLVRAEDPTARFAEAEYCVVLPDTPLAEAEVVMHRIAGILSTTDFAIPDIYQPIRIWVQIGAAAAKPGDDPERLFARARASLDVEES